MMSEDSDSAIVHKGGAIAHTANSAGENHSLLAHLESVAHLASSFMPSQEYKELAYYTGLWSDIGKFDPWWQKAMRGIIEGTRSSIGIPHAHQGAFLALNYSTAAALCIYGHHRGLPDMTEFKAWLSNPDKTEGQVSRCDVAIKLARRAITELVPENSFAEPTNQLEWDFLTRILFSALVDADYSDTSCHYGYDGCPSTDEPMDWNKYMNRVKRKRRGRVRDNWLLACKRAESFDAHRIIYVLPKFAETGDVANWAREVFGENLVIEQRVNLQENVLLDRMGLLRLLSQNWEEKAVVTTEIQLLSALFGNYPEDCRRLHNLTNSVLVFHNWAFRIKRFEAAVLSKLSLLKKQYGCHVVRPALPNPSPQLTIRLGFHKFNWGDVLTDIKDRSIEQAIIICPCAREAAAGYSYLAQNLEGCHYLSEQLYANHRQRVKARVRKTLGSRRQVLPCYLICTEIIYGSMNLTFPHGYQVLGPLPYIQECEQFCAQDLTLFQLIGFESPDTDYSLGAQELYVLLRQGNDLDRDTIATYHKNLSRLTNKDLEGIEDLQQRHSFRVVAAKVRAGSPTNFAFVPQTRSAQKCLEQLESKTFWNKSDYRAIAPYLVGLPAKVGSDQIRKTKQGLLVWTGDYDENLGIDANFQVST